MTDEFGDITDDNAAADAPKVAQETPAPEEAEAPRATADSLFGQVNVKYDWSGLKPVGQKIAVGLRSLLRGRGVETPLTEMQPIEEKRYSEWVDAIRHGDILVKLRFAPLKGHMVLCLPSSLIAQLVDIHYGGDGRTADIRSELSTAERRYAEKLAADMAVQLGMGWREIETIEASYVSIEASAARLKIAAPDENVVVQQWEYGAVNLTAAKISVVMPVESIRRAVPATGGNPQLAGENVDEGWRQDLRRSVLDVSLPVRTIFARPEIAFDKLMSLKAGDIIPITLPRTVPVSVSGMLFAYGSVGESDGRTAIRIESIEKGCVPYE